MAHRDAARGRAVSDSGPSDVKVAERGRAEQGPGVGARTLAPSAIPGCQTCNPSRGIRCPEGERLYQTAELLSKQTARVGLGRAEKPDEFRLAKVTEQVAWRAWGKHLGESYGDD